MSTFIDTLAAGRVIQLGQLIDGQPTKNPGVPDFVSELYEIHDPDRTIIPGQIPGITSAAETISMSTHSGTHMDSLSHIADNGRLFDGTRIDEPGTQDLDRGVRLRSRENFTPLVTRGVLLDFARLLGVPHLPQDYVVTPDEFARCCAAQGVELRPGDVVLMRTGWDTLTADNERYTRMPVPGPDANVARLLVAACVVATGSDTMPYEAAPGEVPLEVHVELLPRAGVFIFEMMDLRELASTDVHEFVFAVAPLRLRGGTGSPVNPLAILLD